jgi:hypothetical protein
MAQISHHALKQEDKVSNWLDSFLILLFVVFTSGGLAFLADDYLAPKANLFAIDWGQAWEIAKGLGLGASLIRGGYAAYKKLKGEEKYYKAIWMVLDDSPYPLPKEEIKERVRQKVGDPRIVNPLPLMFGKSSSKRRDDIFEQKFDSVWMNMYNVGIIARQIGEDKKPVYSLKGIDAKDKKEEKQTSS